MHEKEITDRSRCDTLDGSHAHSLCDESVIDRRLEKRNKRTWMIREARRLFRSGLAALQMQPTKRKTAPARSCGRERVSVRSERREEEDAQTGRRPYLIAMADWKNMMQPMASTRAVVEESVLRSVRGARTYRRWFPRPC